jgi:demethylmenaquinone methyltransferase/2-methoxy-6-polyprenyl-1,4-benzoquinol methylase
MGDTSTQPDLSVVRRGFEGFRARLYDVTVRPISAHYRGLAVERLGLRPGETVIDLGCGTGLSLPLLAPAVGEQGRVIALDASPDMLAIARQRVEAGGWKNIELVEGFAHQFQPERPIDAVLACNVNQLVASREVMQQALSWLRPGGRIVAAGGKGGRGIGGLAVKVFVYGTVRLFQREHTAAKWILHPRPWFVLQELLPSLEVQTLRGGTMYVARGVKRTTLTAP